MAVVTSCENTQTRPTKADKGKIKIKVKKYINTSTSEGNVTFFYLYTLPGKNLPLSTPATPTIGIEHLYFELKIIINLIKINLLLIMRKLHVHIYAKMEYYILYTEVAR